jgi:hypothetical protein
MVNNLTAPGFPCPQCGRRLSFSLVELISGTPLNCPECGLELTLSEEESGATLAVLAELHKQIQQSRDQVRAACAGETFPVPPVVGEC